MDKQVRFRYEGAWTRWFSEGEDLTGLRSVEIQAVEISETMTRAEFAARFPDHPSLQPQT